MQTFTVYIMANSIQTCSQIDSRLADWDGGAAVIDASKGCSIVAMVTANTIDAVSCDEIRRSINDCIGNDAGRVVTVTED